MENTKTNTKRKPYAVKSPGRGGARAGAGRPKGAVDKVTVNGLLETLAAKTNNRDYEEILIEDFLQARANKDTQLVLKYHTLILSKVMSTKTQIEIEQSGDSIAAKQAAFAEALAKFTKI